MRGKEFTMGTHLVITVGACEFLYDKDTGTSWGGKYGEIKPNTDVMTVKQLKKLIYKVPDKLFVILSRDEEGNSFQPLHHMSNRRMVDTGNNLWDDAADIIESPEANCIVFWS
jgi:hypothetical protein